MRKRTQFLGLVRRPGLAGDVGRVLGRVFGCVLACGSGCVPIDGGAVEVSWVVRSRDGRAIADCACADPAIALVRLMLVGVGGRVDGQKPCVVNGATRKECEFSCRRQTGSTPFDIPPGTYAVSVVPADAAGQDLTEAVAPGRAPVRVPAPILRDVVHGQPTQTATHLIEAGCAPSCGGATNDRVCASD